MENRDAFHFLLFVIESLLVLLSEMVDERQQKIRNQADYKETGDLLDNHPKSGGTLM